MHREGHQRFDTGHDVLGALQRVGPAHRTAHRCTDPLRTAGAGASPSLQSCGLGPPAVAMRLRVVAAAGAAGAAAAVLAVVLTRAALA